VIRFIFQDSKPAVENWLPEGIEGRVPIKKANGAVGSSVDERLFVLLSWG